MSRSINRVILFGTVAEDPELTVDQGVAVARFTLDTMHRWKDAVGRRNETLESHVCVARDGPGAARLGTIVGQMATAGARVYVDGRLGYRRDTDGSTVAEVEVGEFIRGDRSPRPVDASR